MARFKQKSILLKGLIFTCFVALVFSCRNNPAVVTRKDLKEMTLQELLAVIDSNKTTFNYINAKISVELKNSKSGNVSFKGKLRMKNDSVIWVSVTPALGIEMARMMATDKELGIINYLQREFFMSDFEVLRKNSGYPLNMKILQSVLIGNPVFINDKSELKLGTQKGMYFVSTTEPRILEKIIAGNDEHGDKNKTLVGNWILGDNYKLGRLVVYDTNTKSVLDAQFEGYNILNGKIFPGVVKFKIESPTNSMELKVEYSKIEFENELDFPFHVPENYKPMKL